jgi:DNA polymerase-3 subunit epsilon
MYLFFDTETTGLPKDWSAPESDVDNWPRMIQLAWAIYNIDGVQLTKQCFIIKPDGFIIPDEAARVHGISTERAVKEGFMLGEVLTIFGANISAARKVVAHNISFDERVVGAEFIRTGLNNTLPGNGNRICTMKSSTEFAKIPSPTGIGYKWPNLHELHFKLFQDSFEGAHDALNDVEACARCFFELKRRNLIEVN